jgi:hypothetical protein
MVYVHSFSRPNLINIDSGDRNFNRPTWVIVDVPILPMLEVLVVDAPNYWLPL